MFLFPSILNNADVSVSIFAMNQNEAEQYSLLSSITADIIDSFTY